MRELVPSPRDVPTYDHKPEMSAREAADAFVRHWRDDAPAFAIINFANPDMVGHTGVIPAAVTAVETVDECLGRVVEAVHASGGACVITADHGNADHMLEDDGAVNTAHSLNPVPFIVTAEGARARGRGHPRRRRADRARAARRRAAARDDGPLAARIGSGHGRARELRARDVLLGGARHHGRRGRDRVLHRRLRLGRRGRPVPARRPRCAPGWRRPTRRAGGRGLRGRGRGRARRSACASSAARCWPGRSTSSRPGRMAAVADPTGAAVELWQARELAGAARVNDVGHMVWNELASPDPGPRARVLRRAARLGGRARGDRVRGDPPRGDAERRHPPAAGSGARRTGSSTSPSSSCDDAVAAVRSGGGSVITGPMDTQTGRVAAVRDPQGAAFAVFEGDVDP